MDWLTEHIDVAEMLTFLAGALVLAVFQWVGRGLTKARRRLRERGEWYERLRRLRTDVTVSYFEQELGLTHAFANKVARGQTEYIYPHKWFFVQALVDTDGQVLLYSVTTRDEDFRPEIWPTSTSPNNYPAVPNSPLGDLTFLEILPKRFPDGVNAFFSGATAPSFYEESFSLGNPGLYLTCLVGLNAAGHHFFDFSDVYSEELFTREVRLGRLAARHDDLEAIEEYLSQDHLARFRSLAKPNTYGIMGQGFPGSEPIPTYLGPDRTQVRTL